MSSRRLLPYGPSAWLVEVDPIDVVALAEAARTDDDVLEAVPGARTVLVRLAPGAVVHSVGERLLNLSLDAARSDATDAHAVVIPVVYEGIDLDAVAEATGLSRAAVVDRHTAGTYRCAFCGFSPGFAYLAGLDPALHLPRRDTPRTRVPPGSVAIASEFTAVYPSASPGGWHLLGTTGAQVWDAARDDPALIPPGTAVHFVEERR